MPTKLERIYYIDNKVRNLQEYFEWVLQNKGHACALCNSLDDLSLHHINKLTGTISSLMNFYIRDEDIVEELKFMHQNNQCPSITLCAECHEATHKRKIYSPNIDYDGEVRIQPWCIVPHPIGIPLCPSRSNCPPGAIGLVAFQTLCGIGYIILNGNMHSRIITINYRRFAELIGKKPTSSFINLFDNALKSLELAGVTVGHIRDGSEFEIHISSTYLKRIRDHYWFFSLKDVPSKSMVALSLKWLLSTKSKKHYYVGLEKLCDRIGLSCKHPPMARKYLKEAVKHIRWISLTIDKNTCHFTQEMRGRTPIHSLRNILVDSLTKEIKA